MAYYGGIPDDINEFNINDFEESINDADTLNRFNNKAYIDDLDMKKTMYKSGIMEKNKLKELSIHDPITNKNIENLPAMVKIPTVPGDDNDLQTKKLLSEKNKYMGISRKHFLILIIILIVILIIAAVGVALSAYFYVIENWTYYEWKLFGIIISSSAILLIIAIFVFIAIYSYCRRKKYRNALYEELENTDPYGNPIKPAKLEKIYKYSKPIKAPPPPPPKPVSVPVPVPVQIKTPIPAPVPIVKVQQNPVLTVRQPPPQRMTIMSKLFNPFNTRPLVKTPAPLIVSSAQPFGTQSRPKFVELRNSVSPSSIQLAPNDQNALVVKR